MRYLSGARSTFATSSKLVPSRHFSQRLPVILWNSSNDTQLLNSLAFKRTFTKSSLKLLLQKQQQQQQQQQGGPTLINLTKTFPSGVKKLYNDYQQYQNINDAANTKINAWSCHHETSKISTSTTLQPEQGSQTHHSSRSLVPRRQREQQKRFLRDIRKVILPVSMACVPIFGNMILVLVAVRPYVFLSNQFFTRDQVRYFTSMSYDKRKRYFDACANDLRKLLGIDITNITQTDDKRSDHDWKNELDVKRVNDEMISIGNVIPLYSKLQQKFRNQTLLQGLSRREILNVTNSSWLTSPMSFIQPIILIQYRLNMLVQDIIQDDINLIRERHHLEGCKSLTIDEIVDACSLRSLPCDSRQTIHSMRESLSEHLQIMGQLLNYIGDEDAFKQSIEVAYLILYTPIIIRQ